MNEWERSAHLNEVAALAEKLFVVMTPIVPNEGSSQLSSEAAFKRAEVFVSYKERFFAKAFEEVKL